VRGAVLEASAAPRGTATSRTPIGEFELSAQAIVAGH
jgi:uncharacterized protein